MRLGDLDKLYDAVEQRYRVSSGLEHRCERDLLDLITVQDGIDAALIIHAQALSLNVLDPKTRFAFIRCYHMCSHCRSCIASNWKYCPHCGAMLDAKKVIRNEDVTLPEMRGGGNQ